MTTPHFHTGPATLGPSLELVQTASFLSTHSIVDKAAFNDSYTQVLFLLGDIAQNGEIQISYNYISQLSTSRFKEKISSLNPAFYYVLKSEATMKLPYGYVLIGKVE